MPSSATNRASQRLHWARRTLDDRHAQLETASVDASFRSYYRTRGPRPSLIVMDAPPQHEDIRPWLDIAHRLRDIGLHAPRIVAEDAEQGFVLMSDLGNTHYLDVLEDDNVDALYGDAMAALLRMQREIDASDLPRYDADMLRTEMQLLPTWFLERHLGAAPDAGMRTVLDEAFRHLADNALGQPQVFVHRDFHSRNLLHTAQDNPGIIDFQGAVLGPITYDLASLLRDCYIVWPRTRVQAWVEHYRTRLLHNGLISPGTDAACFLRWFDLIGLQRHIKVLGIFCRLHYRDGKGSYLNDLPRVFEYVVSVAHRHPELADFTRLLENAAGTHELARPRSGT